MNSSHVVGSKRHYNRLLISGRHSSEVVVKRTVKQTKRGPITELKEVRVVYERSNCR